VAGMQKQKADAKRWLLRQQVTPLAHALADEVTGVVPLLFFKSAVRIARTSLVAILFYVATLTGALSITRNYNR
jgi:hypothetical protein